MASNHLQIILSIQDSWWKKVDRTSLFSISGSWLGLDWGIRSKLLPVALPLRLMFNWVVQSSTDRWPNFTWNDGGATGERKRFLQLCLCCSTSTRQICNMGDISASCTARDWQKLRSCNHCAFVWVCRMCLEALYVIYMWYIYIYLWHFRSRCSRFSHERLKVSVFDGNSVQDYAVVCEPPKHCEVARSRWEVLRHVVDSEWKHPWVLQRVM